MTRPELELFDEETGEFRPLTLRGRAREQARKARLAALACEPMTVIAVALLVFAVGFTALHEGVRWALSALFG